MFLISPREILKNVKPKTSFPLMHSNNKWAGQRTRYSDWLRDGRSRIESRWGGGRDFPHLSRPALRPTQPPVRWVQWVFVGGKKWPGRNADPSSPSSAVVMKEQIYTSNPPIGRTACTEPQRLYKGAVYLYLTPIIIYVVRIDGSANCVCFPHSGKMSLAYKLSHRRLQPGQKAKAKYFLRRSCIYRNDLYTSTEFTEGTQTSVSITLVRLSHVCIFAITTRSVLMCYLCMYRPMWLIIHY